MLPELHDAIAEALASLKELDVLRTKNAELQAEADKCRNDAAVEAEKVKRISDEMGRIVTDNVNLHVNVEQLRAEADRFQSEPIRQERDTVLGKLDSLQAERAEMIDALRISRHWMPDKSSINPTSIKAAEIARFEAVISKVVK